MMVAEAVKWMFDGLFNLVIEPAQSLLLPLDKAIKSLTDKISSTTNEINKLIPPGIMSLLRRMVKNIYKAFMKAAVPGLAGSNALSVATVRALVERERALPPGPPGTRAPTPKPTPMIPKFGPIPLPTPRPTPTPTPPTIAPTRVPTPVPSPVYDWGEEETHGDEGYGEPEAHEPGDVDVDPDKEIHSMTRAIKEKKAMVTDPVYRHMRGWLRKHKEGKAKKAKKAVFAEL